MQQSFKIVLNIGLKSCLDAFEVTPGTVDSCSSLLMDGNLLAISPGGVREALFSDHNYDLIWGKRCGFAKSAIAAKAVNILFKKKFFFLMKAKFKACDTDVYKKLPRSN